jgi:hypothetical protein
LLTIGTTMSVAATGIEASDTDGNTWIAVGQSSTRAGAMVWEYNGTVADAFLSVGSLHVENALWLQENAGPTYVGGSLSISAHGSPVAPTALLHIATNGTLGHIRMDGIAGNPGTAAGGDVWYNTSQKALRFMTPAGLAGAVGIVAAATSVLAIDSATTTEQDLKSYSFDANSLTAGKSIRITAGGFWANTDDPEEDSVTFKFYFGSDSFTIDAFPMYKLGAGTWYLSAMITVYSSGAGGKYRVAGIMSKDTDGGTSATETSTFASSGALDVNTTASADVKLTADFVGGSDLTTLTQEIWTVETLD